MQIVTEQPTTMQIPDAPPVTLASIASAKAAALRELRDVAAVLAVAKGHVLGTWHELEDDTQVAYCRGCWRQAVIDVLRDPHYAGPAISERCGRPDALLANQHESVTRGGAR
jgi:hypothetical protein